MFRRISGSSVSLESPQAMFRDLTGKKVLGVLDYQGVLLDSYMANSQKTDIAIELPTGSGKTLIGLLIAEWRRRKSGARALYLCPTNQLAAQVQSEAVSRFGINVVRFKGQKKNYEPANKAAYEAGEAIAVTSYSALFNFNPYFHNPQTIILDDAHVADNYVAKLWSLEIDADENEELFDRVAQFLRDYISLDQFYHLTQAGSSTAFDRSWVDMVPISEIFRDHTALMGVLDEGVDQTPLFFPWSMIREHLMACNIFLGSRKILFRPLVPPSRSFQPFAGAEQRVYMSATLGQAGNFERLTGVSGATRLPLPPQLEKAAIGRRFFIFPSQALVEEQQTELTWRLFDEADRSVIIFPSREAAKKFSNEADQRDLPQFTIEDLEDDMSGFADAHRGVAILAGRYDGLDFRGDVSRLLVINGMPVLADLEEMFLQSKARATNLLDDRRRSRIIQAVGRCTRAENDFSAVVVLDDELVRYFTISETRALLPSEIQAEVLFGLEQAKDNDLNIAVGRFRAMYRDHDGDDWGIAESEIRGCRERAVNGVLPAASELAEAAPRELEYLYMLWERSYLGALNAARAVIDELQSDTLKGYRAFWELLAGQAARLATITGQAQVDDQARHFFGRAAKGIANCDWLLRMSGISLLSTDELNADSSCTVLIERMSSQFKKTGVSSNKKFNEKISTIESLIANDDAKRFELGILELGRLLGFDAGNVNEEGSPDPWWRVNDQLCFVFEAHSGATAGTLGSEKARQVALQERVIRDQLRVGKEATIISVLLSEASPKTKNSSLFLDGSAVWRISDFRKWAGTAIDMVRDLRLGYSIQEPLMWHGRARAAFVANGVDPQSLVRMLVANRWRHDSAAW